MKDAPLIRNHIVSYTLRLRTFVSCLPGHTETVDRLRGQEGEARCARIVDFILRELGHETESSVENASSQLRKAVTRVRGAQ
jgi:hypothetical protein